MYLLKYKPALEAVGTVSESGVKQLSKYSSLNAVVCYLTGRSRVQKIVVCL